MRFPKCFSSARVNLSLGRSCKDFKKNSAPSSSSLEYTNSNPRARCVNVRTKDKYTPLLLCLLRSASSQDITCLSPRSAAKSSLLARSSQDCLAAHSDAKEKGTKHDAAGAIKCVQLLLRHGANVDDVLMSSDPSQPDRLPLEIALETGQEEIALLLLSAGGGSKVVQTDFLPSDAQLLYQRKRSQLLFYAVSLPSDENALKCLAHMLGSNMHFDINVTADGVSLLLHALRLRKPKIAMFLLEHGADPNTWITHHQRKNHLVWQAAAHLPAQRDRQEMMAALVEANIVIDAIFLVHHQWFTPLIFAIEHAGHGHLVHRLLEAKADVAASSSGASSSVLEPSSSAHTSSGSGSAPTTSGEDAGNLAASNIPRVGSDGRRDRISNDAGSDHALAAALRQGTWDLVEKFLEPPSDAGSGLHRTRSVSECVNTPDRFGLLPLVACLLSSAGHRGCLTSRSRCNAANSLQCKGGRGGGAAVREVTRESLRPEVGRGEIEASDAGRDARRGDLDMCDQYVSKMMECGADTGAALVALPSATRDVAVMDGLLWHCWRRSGAQTPGSRLVHELELRGPDDEGVVSREAGDRGREVAIYSLQPQHVWHELVQQVVAEGWDAGLRYLVQRAPSEAWVYGLWQQAALTTITCGQWRESLVVVEALSCSPSLRVFRNRADTVDLLLALVRKHGPGGGGGGRGGEWDATIAVENEDARECVRLLLSSLEDAPCSVQALPSSSSATSTGESTPSVPPDSVVRIEGWVGMAEVLLYSVDGGEGALPALMHDVGMLPDEPIPTLDRLRHAGSSGFVDLWDLLAVSILHDWVKLAQTLLQSLTHEMVEHSRRGSAPESAQSEGQERAREARWAAGVKECVLAASKGRNPTMLQALLELDAANGFNCRRDLMPAMPAMPVDAAQQEQRRSWPRMGSVSSEHGTESRSGRQNSQMCRGVESKMTADLDLIPVLALAVCGRGAGTRGGGGDDIQGREKSASSDAPRCLRLLLRGTEGNAPEARSMCGGFSEAVVAAAARGDLGALSELDSYCTLTAGMLVDVALFLACLCGSEPCVQMLCTSGARVDRVMNVPREVFAIIAACGPYPTLYLDLVDIRAALTASAVAACSASPTSHVEMAARPEDSEHARTRILLDTATKLSVLTVCSLLDRRGCARVLMRYGADPNKIGDATELYPAAAAAATGNPEMTAFLLAAGARVDTHQAVIEQLLAWERARHVALEVLQQVKTAALPLEHETSSGSLSKEASGGIEHLKYVKYVPPPKLHTAAESDAVDMKLQAGAMVPMTPLIAAVVGFVRGVDDSKRARFLQVCRVLVEAGADTEIARVFFRSECFKASFSGLDGPQDAAHVLATARHPSVLSLSALHLVSGSPQVHAQGGAESGHPAHAEEGRAQPIRKHWRTAQAAAMREAEDVLDRHCRDTRVFCLQVSTTPSTASKEGRPDGDLKNTHGARAEAEPLSQDDGACGMRWGENAPHLAPFRRVQAVAVRVSWNEASLRDVEFLCGVEPKDLRYYRL